MNRKVSVIGLGHIGLPMACILANCGFKVHGVDCNDAVISSVKSGKLANTEKDLQALLKKTIENQRFNVSSIPSGADIHIIAVPTPLDNANQPDLSHVNAVVESIKPHLRPHNLIIIESTCPIGTTDLIAQYIRAHCRDIYVAYCPERVLPGNILHECVYNDRVVGGVDDASTDQAVAFYRTFVRGEIYSTHARMAEAVKLSENAFRDVNIAFANELSMIADRLHLDVNLLIRLANRHPRVNILDPGPGVGGHCIAVDPRFLAVAAPDLALLMTKARDVNIRKTAWVVNKIKEAIKKYGARSIACLGLTYKPNVADMRESPAMHIVNALQDEIQIYRVDPHVPHTTPLDESLGQADIIVGLVAHREFSNIPVRLLKDKIVLDFGRVFT